MKFLHKKNTCINQKKRHSKLQLVEHQLEIYNKTKTLLTYITMIIGSMIRQLAPLTNLIQFTRTSNSILFHYAQPSWRLLPSTTHPYWFRRSSCFTTLTITHTDTHSLIVSLSVATFVTFNPISHFRSRQLFDSLAPASFNGRAARQKVTAR